MRKVLVLLLIMMCFVGSIAAPVQAITQLTENQMSKVWEAQVLPCNLEICGGFPQNIATLSLRRGTVSIDKNGRVMVELKQVRRLATQEIVANKTFEVYLGSFTYLAANPTLLGTITTDAKGNFKGTIDTGNGVPFVFPPGTVEARQFVFNDPGVRSEFITGFNGESWKGTFVPCNLAICGDYPQNVATLSLKRGIVSIDGRGRVTIVLNQLRSLATHELLANKTFEVYLGSFTYLGADPTVLGTITTDTKGNFRGSIDTGNGIPFVFPAGASTARQFVLNDPSVRSEFITGFSIPDARAIDAK